jgi:hypothetical protein
MDVRPEVDAAEGEEMEADPEGGGTDELGGEEEA